MEQQKSCHWQCHRTKGGLTALLSTLTKLTAEVCWKVTAQHMNCADANLALPGSVQAMPMTSDQYILWTWRSRQGVATREAVVEELQEILDMDIRGAGYFRIFSSSGFGWLGACFFLNSFNIRIIGELDIFQLWVWLAGGLGILFIGITYFWILDIWGAGYFPRFGWPGAWFF